MNENKADRFIKNAWDIAYNTGWNDSLKNVEGMVRKLLLEKKTHNKIVKELHKITKTNL